MTMYVITHKEFNYQLPANYRVLLVGANQNINPGNYLADNTLNNISEKNKSFCELTGLYWMWKNTTDEYIGLSHYRRYFSKYPQRKSLDLHTLLTGKVTPVSVRLLNEELDNHADWIVSQPENSGAGSIYDSFAKYHHIKDLEITKQVLSEKYSDYIPAFDKVMSQQRSSFYNMFYTKRQQLDKYCSWLFDILFEVERRTDISTYDNYQQRLYGFLAERLLNVYLVGSNQRVAYRAVYNSDIMGRNFAWHALTEKLTHVIKHQN